MVAECCAKCTVGVHNWYLQIQVLRATVQNFFCCFDEFIVLWMMKTKLKQPEKRPNYTITQLWS